MITLSDSEKIIAQLYRGIFEHLGTNAEFRRVYIYGGRGVGKTAILKAIGKMIEISQGEGESAQTEGQKTWIIEGRDWEVARRELEKHALELESGKRGLTLLLDDVDQLCLLVAIFAGEQEFEATLRSIMRVTAALVNQDGRLFLSATYPQARLLEVLHQRRLTSGAFMRFKAFSSVLLRFDPLQLDPWRSGWKDRARDLILAQLPPDVSELVAHTCQDVILALTGGHPALLTWALLEAHDLSMTPESSAFANNMTDFFAGNYSIDQEKLENLLRRHLEDHLVRKGIIPLRRAISSLRDSDDSLLREAYTVLENLARDPDFVPSLPKSREILLDEGLMYMDVDTSRYVVPGNLLRQEFIQYAKPDTLPATGQTAQSGLKLEPDPHFPHQRGTLVVNRGGESKHIPLSGGSWSVLRMLFENASRTLSLEDLKKPPLNTPVAVRSAIQRLEAKLRREGVVGLLENIYGQGYRLARDNT